MIGFPLVFLLFFVFVVGHINRGCDIMTFLLFYWKEEYMVYSP